MSSTKLSVNINEATQKKNNCPYYNSRHSLPKAKKNNTVFRQVANHSKKRTCHYTPCDALTEHERHRN